MEFKEYILDELFTFPSISSGMTEGFARENAGSIPVYGGRKTETPLSYIQDNMEGIKYFENCLGWNREGSIGYVFYHDHKFTTNDHHRPMILKEEFEGLIDLNYCQIVIQNAIFTMGLTWGKTASKERVRELSIKIPVNSDGDPDLDLQSSYAERVNRTLKNYETIKEYYKKISNSIISVEFKGLLEFVSLADKDIFDLSIGKRVLKKDVKSSGIPLFSANVHEIFGYMDESNFDDFSEPSLIWGIDGVFDWDYIPENIEFSGTDHCGRLQVKDPNIDIRYLFYTLRENAENEGFNRTYRASITRMREEVTVDIPVNEDGDFDLIAQENIVERYEEIEKLKNDVIEKMEVLVGSQIDFN